MIQLKNLSYSYKHRGAERAILRQLNYVFEAGRCYGVTGRSGSGKTTLISLIAGLDLPSGGDILIKGKSIGSLNLDEYRAKTVGVIFQNYNLLPHLNALENVELALSLSGARGGLRQAARELLEELGLDPSACQRRVTTLSGGEQQRVAIARAVAGEPDILVADEPTGNLDVENEENIIRLLLALAHQRGKCVIVASHSPVVMDRADQLLSL